MDTLLWMAILTLPILPNFWCIWHAGRHAFPGPAEQQQWIRVGVFVPILGGLIYLLFGMRRAMPIMQTKAPETEDDTENANHEYASDNDADANQCDTNDGQTPRTGDMQ
ncbi:MAG: hypothetical protein DELT_01885 [Desulfovibrio sp.]